MPLLFCVIITAFFLQGIRWWILMLAFEPSLPLFKALRAHFVGLYYSIVLPTSAGQNVVRAVLISKDAGYSLSWASTWMSGILGLLTLAVMSVYGLLRIDRSALPPGFFESVVSSFAVLLLLFAFSFSKSFTARFRTLFRKLLPSRIINALENIREAVYKYRGAAWNVALVFCITLIMQIIITVGACFVIFGITGKILLFESLLYLPIIEILCISLPLTPNGIGIREALLALMFRQVGLSNEQLGIYVVLGFFSISLKLVGGIPLLFPSNSGHGADAEKAKQPDPNIGMP